MSISRSKKKVIVGQMTTRASEGHVDGPSEAAGRGPYLISPLMRLISHRRRILEYKVHPYICRLTQLIYMHVLVMRSRRKIVRRDCQLSAVRL